MKVVTAALLAPGLLALVASCLDVSHPTRSASRSSQAAPVGPSGVGLQGGMKPNFGETVIAAVPPPPISGGTLSLSSDGRLAVAADPDRDQVYFVDIETQALVRTVRLPERSEPGRVTISSESVYVVLRGSGQIAQVVRQTGEVSLHTVCSAPRGIHFDETLDVVRVACASGELVTIAPEGAVLERLPMPRDLRDVFRLGASLRATRFRSAESFEVARGRAAGAKPTVPGAAVLWRTVVAPDPTNPGCVDRDLEVGVAQEVIAQPAASPVPAYYTATPPCSQGPVGTTATVLSIRGRGTVPLRAAVLPVDVAVWQGEIAVAAAGNAHTPGMPQVLHLKARDALDVAPCDPPFQAPAIVGQATAVAFDADGRLSVQTREPAALHVVNRDRTVDKVITLSTTSRFDTGHAIFHANSGGMIACASCHPDGTDDGRVWSFPHGVRRTPSLRGTLEGTAPYHWDGDLADVRALVDSIFVTRMAGPPLVEAQTDALRGWLFTLEGEKSSSPVTRAVDVERQRGEETFRARCASCHAGPRFTNNANADVGTGGVFQVPSLIGLAARPPYLHNGCATTLFERFSARCGGGRHGDEGLSSEAVRDLVSYLEQL